MPAAAALGLTFLSKETGIILLGAVFVFLALSQDLRLRIWDLIIAMVVLAAGRCAHAGHTPAGWSAALQEIYLAYQLFRRPNHDVLFYLQTVPPAIGIMVIVVAILGLVFLFGERSWRENIIAFVDPCDGRLFSDLAGERIPIPAAHCAAGGTLLAGRFLGKLAGGGQRQSFRGARLQLSDHASRC